jgi:hypothetical protein
LPVIELSILSQDALADQDLKLGGYQIASLEELSAHTRLYQQAVALAADIYRRTHASSPAATLTPAEWEDVALADAVKAGCFVATTGSVCVGLIFVHEDECSDTLTLGWLGVAHAYRHQGKLLVQSLFGQVLRFAREAGYTRIEAEIDTTDPWAWLLLEWFSVNSQRAWITFRNG